MAWSTSLPERDSNPPVTPMPSVGGLLFGTGFMCPDATDLSAG